MTHLRGKALPPTTALPLLSPPYSAAHALHRRLSAQPQSVELPAPADLNLSFPTDGSGAQKRRSSAAALPQKRFDTARNHRRPRTSGTGRDLGSPPDLRLRSAGTFPPSPHKRACLRRLCPAQEQASRTPRQSLRHQTQRNAEGIPPLHGDGRHVFPCFFIMPRASRRRNSPAPKTIFALPASRRGKPIGTRPFAPWALRRDAGERSTRPRCYSRRRCSALSLRRRSEIYGQSKRHSPGYAESPSRRSGLWRQRTRPSSDSQDRPFKGRFDLTL